MCILIIVLGWLMDYQQLSNTGEAALPYWNNLVGGGGGCSGGGGDGCDGNICRGCNGVVI